MKIFNEDTNKSLSNITILLTKNEILQLISNLENLSSDIINNNHFHLNSDDYSKEITISLYDQNGVLDYFEEKYRKLILSDE